MRLGRRRAQTSAGGGDNPYWISFSDLMSALLMIFILAVAVLVLQLIRAQTDLDSERETVREQEEIVREQQERFATQVGTLQEAELIREEMLVEMQDRLHAEGIEVHISEDSSVLSIPTALLGFEATAYELNSEYHQVATTIGAVIANVLATDDRYQYLDTVFVEGHTDNVGFHGLEGSGNWGLSTFRAISLWRLWDEQLPEENRLDTFVSSAGAPLFSVSGYGETRPVTASQNTDEERAANRRIDIRFTVVRPSAEDLSDIVDLLEDEAN